MDQEFNCKEKDCKEKVVFKYNPVEFIVKTFPVSRPKKANVYLTCKNKHTHQYEVELPNK